MDKDRDIKFKIVLSPEYANLKEDIERLKVELSILLAERDNLTLQICPRIEAQYLYAIGELEKQLETAEYEYRRLKRMCEIVIAKQNRQEEINLQEIEAELDSEYSEFERAIEELIRKLLFASQYMDEMAPMDEDESAQLKKLYRSIVKKLHPDIAGNVTEEQTALFNSAVAAYENGDLQRLKAIAEMAGIISPAEPAGDGIEYLKKEKERLYKLVCELKEEITDIKEGYPYILIEFVQDEEKMEKRRREYRRDIREYRQAAAEYKKRLDELLRQA